jgi:polysaccharide pyruvyl transferase WcaK-like protein
MKIGLYGILGTYNFGCEAIVRGARQFINDIFPGAEVIYFSFSYDYDKKSLANTDIQVKAVKEKKSIMKRCINKTLSMTGIPYRVLYFDQKEMLNDIDMIFSIGGDIYTIPEVVRQNMKYNYYNPLVDFCQRSKKPVVVYGASVGPWGDYDRAVSYYKKNMKKYRAILCREKSSVDYLHGLDFTNVSFFPDPAFLLGEGKNYNGENIGFNLSPLSLKELYGQCGEEQIRRFSDLLDRVYEKYNMPLLFIPHVISRFENDNDLIFLKKIKCKMKHSDKVLIADSNNGFMGAKEYLRKCKILVSARMHCAINALEENVPTILLSYSQKSIGMCDYVYNNEKWVLDIKYVEDKLFDLMDEMLLNRDVISTELAHSNKRIKSDYDSNLLHVSKLLVNG